MERIEIVGGNYFGRWDHTRTACRGIVLRGDGILTSYETSTGQYMIPGGGLEPGESEADCCAREVAEETGVLVEPGEPVLEIDEYYENWKYVSLYFICKPVGECERRLTEREKKVGMEPRWVRVERAVAAFSRHQDYAATDEMRRGLYLREFTALKRLLGGPTIRPMSIGDYDRVWDLWMSCKNVGMTFAEMQTMYRTTVNRFKTIENREWKAEGAMIELSKQVGELAKQVMLKERYYAFTEDETTVDERLGNEMADVIAQVMRLADHYGIDLERAFIDARKDEDAYLKSRDV